MNEIPQYVVMVGSLVGSAVAAFVSKRSLAKSTATQTEIEGPGDEPSLRKLIKDHGLTLVVLGDKIAKDFGALHIEVTGLSARIENLEKAVFLTLEKRIVKVEDYLLLHVSTIPPRPQKKKTRAVQHGPKGRKGKVK